MKKYILFLLFGFILSSNVFAAERYLTGGLNVSLFYDVGSKPLLGFSLGVGKEWRVGKKYSLTTALSYYYRGALVENKMVYHPNWLNIFNAHWRVGYMEIPLSLKMYLSNHHNNSFYISSGISTCLAIYDGSTIEQIYKEPSPPKYFENKADYDVNEDPGFLYQLESSTIDISICAGKKTKRIAIESQIRMNALGEVGTLHGVRSINSKFLTFAIIGYYYF